MANRIGHYELIADLGSGGMGKVYRARDTRLDREVALKVLWPQLAEHPAAVARFEREARAVARIRHPHVVAVYDIGNADGYHYLAMEYVAGSSLRVLLKGQLSLDKAFHYFKQMLSGLGAAHELGVVHRDLKPGNILIESATDTIKLADFGLARIAEEEVSITQSGELLGTLEYMAPELGRGAGASLKSDLYAVGVVFYRLLTGRFPFEGATPSAILKAHECGSYPQPTTITSGLPPQADAVLARLLACEPANRYADCQAVFADLERWERGEAIPLEFAAAYEPIDHELERHRVPGWKRVWAQTATWFHYQWLEAFNRTELTTVRLRDEVTAAETELGKARRRLEEATLLRNRVRARADEATAAMRECVKAAEQAYAAGDEAQTRQQLAAKLEAKERAEELEREAAQSEQVVTLARQEFEGKAATIAELRHSADLLLARRRRAKLEMSVLGVLPVGERRWGERFLAIVKLVGPVVLLAGGLYYWLRPAPIPARTTTPPQPGQSAPVALPDPPVPNQVEADALPPATAAPSDGRWGQMTPLLFPRSNLAAAAIDNTLYVMGGFNLKAYQQAYNSVERLILGNNRWTSVSPPQQARLGAGAVALDGKIYVVSGGADGGMVQTIDEYDPGLDRWRTVTEITSGQHTPAVAAYRGKLYLVGGLSLERPPHSIATVSTFDPATGQWGRAANLKTARNLNAVAVVGDDLYTIAGQRDLTSREYLASVERYDPVNDRWVSRSDLNHPRSYVLKGGASVNGKIYVFGGWDGSSRLVDAVECYDPARNRWTDVSRMANPRTYLATATIGNTIYVIGGEDMVGNAFSLVETFTP